MSFCSYRSRRPYQLALVIALAGLAGATFFACTGSGGAIPDTPDGTVLAIADALANDQPGILWDAIPPSYQQDVNDVIHEFAGKMDPEIWDGIFAVLGKLTDVLGSKRDFILAHPMLATAVADRAEAEQKWDSVVGMLDTLVKSDLASLDKLKVLDIQTFLVVTGAQLMAQAAEVSEISAEDTYNEEFRAKLIGLQVEVIESSADTAKLRITDQAGESEEVDMVRVEGRWIPKELNDGWQEAITSAKEGLAKITPEEMAENKPQVMMTLGMAEGAIDKLAATSTQADFDAEVAGAMTQIMGAMFAFGG